MGKEQGEVSVEDLTYNDAGLIPCIVQDADTKQVLMMAWMNAYTVQRTLDERTTWFYSRSRKKLWHKGEESGNVQELVDLQYDCDADTLLAQVRPAGPACHTGHTSCFYRSLRQGDRPNGSCNDAEVLDGGTPEPIAISGEDAGDAE